MAPGCCYFCDSPCGLDSQVIDAQLRAGVSALGGFNARACFGCAGRLRRMRIGDVILHALRDEMGPPPFPVEPLANEYGREHQEE